MVTGKMQSDNMIHMSANEAHPSNGQLIHNEAPEIQGSRQRDNDQTPPVKKKRRSRKALEKRFACSAEGCGKSYSRAEHLLRHQLNHGSAETFYCQYPDCARTFVRPDLLKRHLDRHSAKENHVIPPNQTQSQTQPKESVPHATALHGDQPIENASQPAFQQSPGQFTGSSYSYASREHERQFSISSQHENTQGSSTDTMYTLSNHYHNDFRRTSEATNQSIQSRQQNQGIRFVEPSGHAQLALQPGNGNFSYSSSDFGKTQTPATSSTAEMPQITRLTVQHPETESSQSAELLMLDQMAMNGSGPVFGSDSALQKSPRVGMPEDFMAYLFNSAPENSSTSALSYPQEALNYGDLQHNVYAPRNSDPNAFMGQHPAITHNIMAVNNLVDANVPEASISDMRSQELFDFIRDRFHGNEHPTLKRLRESIVAGDRNHEQHMLSRQMMQAYIWSYWYHFSDQMPILHKPSFSSDQAPTLLLLAMMAIGASCLDKTHGPEVTIAGASVSNFIAAHLRWELFMDPNFRPPAKLWVFQALILLELYEKMCSTRELHERAHIHHATTITLMRRGRSLIGKSALDTPPTPSLKERNPSAYAPLNNSDEWWRNWIAHESTRRTACAAFVIDSIHSSMFGHSGVMVTHEMRLPLPCDDSLWKATSSAELGRAEANLTARGETPVSFLEGLKRTLSNQEVKTTSFGRTVLMAGLLSVTYHMHQRDLQVNVLGSGVGQTLGGRDKWRATLTGAYDHWKADYDKDVQNFESLSDPYRHGPGRASLNVLFESRTVLHHLAHMAMHADIVDCQMFARAKRLLGRTVGAQEFSSAQRRIQHFWAPSARARDAMLYALQFLRSVLAPDLFRPENENGSTYDQPYEVRHDLLLNRPWVLYFAALVVWTYGYAVEGACPNLMQPETPQGKWMYMREYLAQYASIPGPEELKTARGLNQNTSLLMVLKDLFETSRWELLHEAANLLQNCIILNTGGTIL